MSNDWISYMNKLGKNEVLIVQNLKNSTVHSIKYLKYIFLHTRELQHGNV